MKLCKDCKHFKVSLIDRIASGLEYGKCYSLNQGQDLVTGYLNVGFASVQGQFSHLCGSEAKWYEPKS